MRVGAWLLVRKRRFRIWKIGNTREQPVFGLVFKEPWFDIGSLEELERARKEFGKE
ncbi:MAG: hypothetical protein ACE5FW_02715 [Candidatus Aenigmatarchaeota archaeon]